MVRLARAQRSFKVSVSNFQVERAIPIFSRANLECKIIMLSNDNKRPIVITTNCN